METIMKSNVDKLIQQLNSEKAAKYKNGIYHFTQTSLAYNSNRIEGSKLSHEHTINLFNTHTLLSSGDEVIDSNNIIETMNHFRAFDYILQNYNEPLNEELIKHLHEFYREPGYLTDTCLSAQDKYIAYCRHLVKDFA